MTMQQTLERLENIHAVVKHVESVVSNTATREFKIQTVKNFLSALDSVGDELIAVTVDAVSSTSPAQSNPIPLSDSSSSNNGTER